MLLFQKQPGNGLAAISVEWNAKTDTPSGPELKWILENTVKLDWPQGARVQLNKKVDEIKKLGAAQGDEKLLHTREAVCMLAGWSTLEWAANQEVRHQGEMRAQKSGRPSSSCMSYRRNGRERRLTCRGAGW